MFTHGTPGLDPRWPFPVVLILLYSMILFPSVAILAMYAPIMAYEHNESESGHAYPFACGALVFSGISALHVICSFGVMIFSSLAPVVVMILGTISALSWGAAIGGSRIFWQKNRSSICQGEWGHDWRCEYDWITLLCSSLAAGASFLIVLISWHAFLKHIRHPNRDRKWKQASTSVIALGPPSTPPVNLANSRAGRQNEVDSLLEQGSILETSSRPSNLYNTTQRAEFLAAGGAGKLILPQYLDPTSSGFIPGRLLYGPTIPEPSRGDKKGKGKQRESMISLQDASQQSKETVRKSLLGEELVYDSTSYSNRNSTASIGLYSPAPIHTRPVPKPLPALPVQIMDSAILPARPSPYFPQQPQPPKFVTQHHSHSDTWDKPISTVQSVVRFPEQDSLPPPIPPRHPLRRISSAPPGSLDLHSAVPVIPGEEASYYESLRGAAILKPPRPITDWPTAWRQEIVPRIYTEKSVPVEKPAIGPGRGGQATLYPLSTASGSTYTPARTTTEISTQSTASGAKPGVPLLVHTPRKSSNLMSSFTPADLDTSGVDGESGGQQIGSPSEENSWERGVEELLHRVGYDFQSPSSPLDLSPVASSNALPRSEAPAWAGTMVLAANTSEEPKLGPVKREDTFSSEESDESLGLDPEKMDLVGEMVETAIQQAAVASSPATQEMVELPKSPSLTLPIRNLTHKRSVSSPTPLHIPSAHPVLQLSHGIITAGTTQPFPYEAKTNARNRVVSEASPFGREFVGTAQPKVVPSNLPHNYRYTTVAPLTITKELPPLPKLPPLQIKPPQFDVNPSNSSTPTTPKSLRTPIADLKAQCVGHFTVSPTGEVEMSAQNSAGAPSPYRGRIESISSTGWKADQDAVPSPTPATILKTTERKGGSLELTERLPLTRRKRSKSGPPGTSVRFELSRNEVYAGRTWGSSSEEGSR